MEIRYYVSMMKKTINVLLVATIVFIGVCIVGIFVLGGLAQSTIQIKGSEGLGVKLTLDSAHVGFFTKKQEL